MGNTKLIVWSKDRGCQLDLLLRSIKKNADLFDVSVIYKASSEEFQKGYNRCLHNHNDVSFILETDFYTDTISCIDSAEFTGFCTDDMVFYRSVPSEPLFPKRDNWVFSFRLGKNTTLQNCHTGETQPPLYYPKVDGTLLSWCPKDYHPFTNYGYPLALDTHIFRTSYLAKLLKKCGHFSTSNQLESAMQSFRMDIDFLCSYIESVAVNIPVNNLSTITRAGEKFSYDTTMLNEAYLSGKIINLIKIEESTIFGCHQELELELVDG